MDSTNNWENYLAGSILIVASVPGIFIYILLCTVLVINRHHYKNVYYTYLFSVSVSNSILLLVYSMYCGVCTLTQTTLGGHRTNTIMGAMVIVGWFSSLPTLQMMVASRYLEIGHASLAKNLHTPKRIAIVIVALWVYGIIYGIVTLQDCCTISFEFGEYSYNYDYLENYGSLIMSYMDMANCALTLLVVIFFNLATIYKIRKSTEQVSTALNAVAISDRLKVQRKLFMMTLTVSCFFGLNALMYFIVPYVTVSKWAFLASTVSTVIDRSMDGYINVFFNNLVWNHVAAMCRKTIVTRVTTITPLRDLTKTSR